MHVDVPCSDKTLEASQPSHDHDVNHVHRLCKGEGSGLTAAHLFQFNPLVLNNDLDTWEATNAMHPPKLYSVHTNVEQTLWGFAHRASARSAVAVSQQSVKKLKEKTEVTS